MQKAWLSGLDLQNNFRSDEMLLVESSPDRSGKHARGGHAGSADLKRRAGIPVLQGAEGSLLKKH
jgi:hypothetical protein